MSWRGWMFAFGGALLVGAGSVYGLSERRLGARFPVVAERPVESASASALERGEHLARSLGRCEVCHGADLGGMVISDDWWRGRLYGSNLTPGRGGIGDRTNEELALALRYGLRPDGTPLLMMPSDSLYHLSSDDLGALIAYLRSLVPVDRFVPQARAGVLSRLLIAAGVVPELIPAAQLHASPPPRQASVPGEDASYGKYVVEIGGCRICHKAHLGGGRHLLAFPDEPTPPDLRPGGPLDSYSARDFVRAMRRGETPDGRALDDRYMPWPQMAAMTDQELLAMWTYLRGLSTPGAPEGLQARPSRELVDPAADLPPVGYGRPAD